MIITEQMLTDLRQDLESVRDTLSGQVIELQNRVGWLEGEVRRVGDLAQNAEYLAIGAKSAADDARNTAQRGW